MRGAGKSTGKKLFTGAANTRMHPAQQYNSGLSSPPPRDRPARGRSRKWNCSKGMNARAQLVPYTARVEIVGSSLNNVLFELN